MKRSNDIIIFVVGSFLLYFIFSLICIFSEVNFPAIARINLLKDIIQNDTRSINFEHNQNDQGLIPVKIKGVSSKDISLYLRPNLITNFNTDTSKVVLENIVKKLDDLKNNKSTKIRIAFFGDSMIEGDLITQTFRKLLQDKFGGQGVGFVPIMCPSDKFRSTAIVKISNGWQVENFQSSLTSKNLFISGYLFKGQNEWVEIVDHTITDTQINIQKNLFYGYANFPSKVKVNTENINIPAKEVFGKILLNNQRSGGIKISTIDNKLPIYGISFESQSGVFVDNFSYRGISGVELNMIDTALIKMLVLKNSYDLIILQYGVNVLFKPDGKNFNWYAKLLKPVIQKLKNSFGKADILIVSTADRAFRYDGTYKSAVGIDSLVKVQAGIAYENGVAFYNQFATMGGENSMVSWVNSTPKLANKDHIHPNPSGAKILAENFFNAFIKDFNKHPFLSSRQQ